MARAAVSRRRAALGRAIAGRVAGLQRLPGGAWYPDRRHRCGSRVYQRIPARRGRGICARLGGLTAVLATMTHYSTTLLLPPSLNPSPTTRAGLEHRSAFSPLPRSGVGEKTHTAGGAPGDAPSRP